MTTRNTKLRPCATCVFYLRDVPKPFTHQYGDCRVRSPDVQHGYPRIRIDAIGCGEHQSDVWEDA